MSFQLYLSNDDHVIGYVMPDGQIYWKAKNFVARALRALPFHNFIHDVVRLYDVVPIRWPSRFDLKEKIFTHHDAQRLVRKHLSTCDPVVRVVFTESGRVIPKNMNSWTKFSKNIKIYIPKFKLATSDEVGKTLDEWMKEMKPCKKRST